MTRILLRAPKGPFDVVPNEVTLADNLIGNNSGNLIFIESAHRLLATRDTTITADRFDARGQGAARINERFDTYVIPLANAFRTSYRESLIRMTELIEGLRIPVVVLGVGAQANVRFEPGRLRAMDDVVRRFARAVLERGPSIGVRGAYTADYLADLGFHDVEVIGCPSMFLHGDRLEIRDRGPALATDARVAINVSPYVKAMGPIVSHHLARYPNLTYIAQDIETLESLLWGEPAATASQVAENPVHRSHPFFTERRTRLYADPWPWISDLAGFDFSFGTRIHGNIAALLAGTPAYVLAHDSRTLELARYFEIPHTAMPDLPHSVDAADLYASADYGPLQRGHPARFATFTAFLARHGLHHVFEPGEDPAAFMTRVAATAYPPAIGVRGDAVVGVRRRRVTRALRAVRRTVRRRLARFA